MIVRLLLWRVDDPATFEGVRERLDELEPLRPPSAWLRSEGAERIGVLLFAEEDEEVPESVGALRGLVGRDPDLYEEFDVL